MKFKTNISTDIAGIKFKNPVITASGTFGYGDEISDIVPVNKIGGIVTKTITLKPKKGNPPPRLVEVTGGILNAIGLQNVGLEKFIEEKSDMLKKISVPVIVSIAGESAEDYSAVAARLSKVNGLAGIELNLSCPNLQKKIISQDLGCVKEIIKEVKKKCLLPVIAKLSPQVTSLTEIAKGAKDAGADALSLVNTFPGMAINITTWRHKLSNVTGGLSGPAIKPLALRCVWEIYNNVDINIIGGGGIMTAEDAVEFLLAGARAVSVGTANFVDPMAPVKIIEGIENYLQKRKIIALKDIIGKAF